MKCFDFKHALFYEISRITILLFNTAQKKKKIYMYAVVRLIEKSALWWWSYWYIFQIQALCSSMQDSSVLVQRSALDFLLVAFPMHNSQLVRPDMIKVITATIKVVLRRDMSLNRRLYAWLLGTDANGVPMQVCTTKSFNLQHFFHKLLLRWKFSYLAHLLVTLFCKCSKGTVYKNCRLQLY